LLHQRVAPAAVSRLSNAREGPSAKLQATPVQLTMPFSVRSSPAGVTTAPPLSNICTSCT
jgi:hypothetical protein